MFPLCFVNSIPQPKNKNPVYGVPGSWTDVILTDAYTTIFCKIFIDYLLIPQQIFLLAKTEEEIFAHLGLEYIKPWERNA